MKKATLLIIAVTNCIILTGYAADTSPSQASGRDNGSTASASSATSPEGKFVSRAASSGMAEVQMGQIALQKGTHVEVKKMGQMMIDDHTKANKELASIAAKGGLAVPTNLYEDHAKMGEKLMNSEAGKDFDNDFVKAMVKSHKMTVEEFEDAQKDVTNPALKEYIDKTLPVLRAHLDHAKHLEDSLK